MNAAAVKPAPRSGKGWKPSQKRLKKQAAERRRRAAAEEQEILDPTNPHAQARFLTIVDEAMEAAFADDPDVLHVEGNMMFIGIFKDMLLEGIELPPPAPRMDRQVELMDVVVECRLDASLARERRDFESARKFDDEAEEALRQVGLLADQLEQMTTM